MTDPFFCPNCENPIDGEFAFCPHCGRRREGDGERDFDDLLEGPFEAMGSVVRRHCLERLDVLLDRLSVLDDELTGLLSTDEPRRIGADAPGSLNKV